MARLVRCHVCGGPLAPDDAQYIDGRWYCDEHAPESEETDFDTEISFHEQCAELERLKD